MERAKKSRKVHRASFTKQSNIINEKLKDKPLPIVEVRALMNALELKYEEIRNLDASIFENMLVSDASEEQLELETEVADEYVSKFHLIKEQTYALLKKNTSGAENDSINMASDKESDIKKRFKLPKIEIQKYADDLEGWFEFWGLFKKIHEDTGINNEEKFQYLIQSTKSGSRARKVVTSYPPSEENYSKAIEALKRRFGREDLLIEMYMRKLLNLVMISHKQPLVILYDDLECQIRSLESLGVTTNTCAAMLFSLVESCLPEDRLRAWHRKGTGDTLRNAESKLNDLMDFIREEVENEEKVTMAARGIGNLKFKEVKENNKEFKIEPTATPSGLLATSCIFCNNSEHRSSDCSNAQRMSLDKKRQILINKGCCFFCLRPGHITKKCKVFIKCNKCQKRHCLVMCPELTSQNSNKVDPQVTPENTLMENSLTTVSSSSSVFLQTLLVIIRGSNNYERVVRALIDTGSQRSYILSGTVKEIGLQEIASKNIIQCVFGGSKLNESAHSVHRVHLSNLKKDYFCNFLTLSQEQICGEIPVVNKGPWEHENIEVADNFSKIEILIGADVAGKPNSTTKIRPVFDGSAHERAFSSLNYCLEKGPNLIEQLPKMFFNFRLEKLGVIADIRKAFLQIDLIPTDRDFLRFLWKDSNGNIKVLRHCRVVFGVSSSPFLLGAVIKYHIQRNLYDCRSGIGTFLERNVEKLCDSFYVDNCMTSFSNQNDLDIFVREAKEIMLQAQFDLRGWEQSFSWSNDDDKSTNVLGLVWDKEYDTLAISLENLKSINFDRVTKRTLLSVAQRVFDPIGMCAPVTLYPKLILQSLWKEKLRWDDEINIELKNRFVKWVNDLQYLSKIRIPRYLAFNLGGQWKTVSIHTFCDASQKSYAAVSYVRIKTDEGVCVQLLQAKCRVAPLKKVTIPRLELMAATVGSRLAGSIEALNIFKNASYFYWTDSSTVLEWLKRPEQWAVFVRNRVLEILKHSSISQWNFVPGSLNPADLLSRGCSTEKLLSSRWWEGPDWLQLDSDRWPIVDHTWDEQEIENEKKKVISSCIVGIDSLPNFYKYFSKFFKVVRMLAWMKRFIHNCRNSVDKHNGDLTVEEVKDAEILLFKIAQMESFPGGISDSTINFLYPVADDVGVIRVRTKVSQREDTVDFRYPILLSGKHPVVEKLIRYEHEKACHAGVQVLLGVIRERFWILKARRSIKAVVSKCVICKRFSTKRIEAAPVALPVDRVRDAAAFEVVGVDLAGPFYLKTGQKAWVALYTCGVYRAVHLELLSSLSTEVFIQSLRRFIARRGRPKIIFSDNGSNFLGTINAFSKLNWDVIFRHNAIQQIMWKFNPPTAAWWGGWWERLVKLLKELLRRTLGRASLDMEELCTILCDCEAVINSRPISYVSETVEDLEPLTPAMFIQDIKETGVPDCDKVDAVYFSRRTNYRRRLIEDLRKRFRLEYLGELRQRNNQINVRPLKVGELVLIGNDFTKRLDWPLARITELLHGADGKVRLVRLKTKSGQLLRPVQRVYPLEIFSMDNSVFGRDLQVPLIDQNKETSIQCGNSDRIDANTIIKTRSGRISVKPTRYTSQL